MMIGKSAIMALVLVLAVAGCTASQKEQTKNQVDDALINATVRLKISAVDPATVSTVHVRVLQGVVTLTGAVKSRQVREKIDNAARSIDGVKSVDDRIAVNPKAASGLEAGNDLALAAKVQAALAGQTGLNAFRLNVTAKNGVITVTGDVPSKSIHDTVIETIRGTSGVKSVVDGINIRKM